MRSEGQPSTELSQQGISLNERVRDAHHQERRRIAREFHDATAQLLTTLSLSVGKLQASIPPDEHGLIDEIRGVVDELFRDIRTFSFLGHPPALEGRTFVEAFRMLTSGFAQRTAIAVETELAIKGTLRPEHEACFYGIVQEALSNVFRHANATEVWVHIWNDEDRASLSVRDNGHDVRMRAWTQGVGLDSMRERAEELGGVLTLQRSPEGTTLVAILPTS
jgi:two-component system NarL family sensor kinase